MSDEAPYELLPPVTRTQLATAVRQTGVRAGGILMLHTQMSAIGNVIGGADTVVLAVQDALGPAGTLLVYTCWEHDAFHIADWPEARRAAYLAEPPVFDPDVSQAWSGVGRLPERVRTWPGARRSAHPLASVAALGPDAEWLTRDHRLDDGYGPTSPFARLVERGGQILLLGAPLDTITLMHHAEAIARVAEKRRNRFPARIKTPTGIEDVEIDEIDTSRGTFDYVPHLPPGVEDFAQIASDALAAGVGKAVQVGGAASHLFEAVELLAFAVAWMEARFGER